MREEFPGDLNEYLKAQDPTTLIELLGLSSEEILERFQDVVEDRLDYILGELELLYYDGEED